MGVTSAGIQTVLQQLNKAADQARGEALAGGQADHGPSFAGALADSIDRIDALKKTAGAEGHAFERGEPGISVNRVMVDSQKAGLAFQMGVQVRNQVVTAYKDIMNMQV